MKRRSLITPLFAFASFLSTPALAQWQYIGTPISATVYDQSSSVLCSDGAGGAIIAWEDYRADGFSADVYAQRVNSSGVPLWTANGVVVAAATNTQAAPRIISDGAGGAIITFMDLRNLSHYDIYAQRINASGVPQWTANGVLLTSVTFDQEWPMIVADGLGGALITWQDRRNSGVTGRDVYAQRISSTGVAQWAANGVALSAATGDQTFPQIAPDGSNGAIVVWRDLRAADLDIYAQRVNSAGVPQWTANGVPVCAFAGHQYIPTLIADGAGGAIITWQDERSGAGNQDIYAQRVNSAGAALWQANGRDICTAVNHQNLPNLVSDGSLGAIITWLDNRGANTDVYAQRIGGAGNPLWTGNGVPVCAAAGSQLSADIMSDGTGGAIVTWADPRSGTFYLYAQRIDGSSVVKWATDGVQASSGANVSVSKPIADGSGNALVAWWANLGTDSNVYAQRIDGRYGYWGKPEPTLSSAKDVPADQGGKVRLQWYGSGRDVLDQAVITYYSIWRAIDQAAFTSASSAGVPVVDLSDMKAKLSGKAIRHEKAQAVDYFWELIGEEDATYRYAYAFTASTSFDSTAANAATHRFQVVSHVNQFINWPSNILTGRSVDNLAPPAPLFLTAQRIGNYVYLKWNGVHLPDLDKYTVYRATSSGVTPIVPNFLADDTDTLLTDTTAPATALYYIVTATDVHQNQGPKSNEASVGAASSTGNLPPITALTVLQNFPNPFTGQTRLQVGLPARSDVRVDIYDVAGRRVRTVVLPGREKGWNLLPLSAKNDANASLSSGVYFYRVHAGGATVTRKMVIAR